MFTGNTQELGTVIRAERGKGLIHLTISAPRTAAQVQRLESVAVNGTCLSVVSVHRPALAFEIIQETRQLTTLGALRPGDQVNLEPSLSVSDRLNGHLLFGHVDGLGTIIKRRHAAGELVLEVRLAAALWRFLVPKGPVAVDGVSLTVGQVLGRSSFSVHLIPETLRQTTLRSRQVGDPVNIELDYFAKLVSQFLSSRETLAGRKPH